MYNYYFQCKLKSRYPYETFENFVLRNSSNEEVSFKWQDTPSFYVSFNRIYDNLVEQPQNDEFNDYKEIAKEDFYKYLAVTIDVLKSFSSKDVEIYIDKPSKLHYEIVYFSINPKKKFHLTIDIRYDLDWGTVSVDCWRNINRKRYLQRTAIPISVELYEYIRRKTFEYIIDDQNYLINFPEYSSLIESTYQGKVIPILPDNTINIAPLVSILSNQVRDIETRLMRKDNDTNAIREKLRGEIEGLSSAIFAINNYFQDVK
jgi:hypothetical protein